MAFDGLDDELWQRPVRPLGLPVLTKGRDRLESGIEHELLRNRRLCCGVREFIGRDLIEAPSDAV